MATEFEARAGGQNNGGGFFQQASRNRTVRLVILVTGALYLTAMIYGGGMKRQIKTLQVINEQLKDAKREYRLSQMDLRLRLAALQQLEARRQVGLATMSAQTGDNVGTQKHVGEAVRLLGLANAAQTSNADLSDVLADLKKAEGSSTSQTDLTQIAARIDIALDKQVPDVLQNSADTDKAHPITAPTMNDVPQLPGNDVTNTGPQ